MVTCRTIVLAVAAVLPALAGCATSEVNQGPLASDGFVEPAPSRSLVVGGRPMRGVNTVENRNDDALGLRPRGVSLYYGPDGGLRYPDGTPVPFEGVTRQLQDLRAQQRIR